jgi:hypothetical protein
MERWSIGRVVKLIVGLISVFGLLAVFGYFENLSNPRVEPGSVEHAAYLREQVANCATRQMAEDMARSRKELPTLPTRAEREAECWIAEKETDRLYPEARPLRRH